MQTGLRLGFHMFCRCHRHRYSIVHHCKTKNDVSNFARFDSLACIVARSLEKSRSLSLAPFLARCRSLSLTGLIPIYVITIALPQHQSGKTCHVNYTALCVALHNKMCSISESLKRIGEIMQVQADNMYCANILVKSYVICVHFV